MKSKVKDFVTQRIIEKIEAGGTDFLLPFAKGSGAYRNAVSGKAYRGINVLMAGLLGNGDTLFGTVKQWKELTGDDKPLKEGAAGQGVPIVYYKMLEPKKEGQRPFPLLKYSTVFGMSHVANPPARFVEQVEQENNKLVEVDHVEAYIKATKAVINRTGTRACYYPALDTVEMPDIRLWTDISRWYPVMLHELTHWTKHESRCNRKQSKKWGDRDYAFEELIAELGSAFQCRTLGLHSEVRDDHAAYVESWLKSMKGDSSYIFDAAKFAQEAVDYIESLQPQEKTA